MKTLILFLPIGMLTVVSGCSKNNAEEAFAAQITNHELISTPVYTDFYTDTIDDNLPVCLLYNDQIIHAQVESVSDSIQRIWWVTGHNDELSEVYTLHNGEECQSESNFSWEQQGHASRLLFDGRPVIRYEHPVFDPENIEETKTPFHHVYSPSGDRLITKGPGGLYSHHRGIFFGYNRISVNDNQFNTWAASNGERSEHSQFIKNFAGPVMGGHVVTIHWKDREGKAFIEEIREIRTFKISPDEILVDFQSTLHATDGPVILDGDRQHAGVQFRASQYVAENANLTRFIRPADWSHKAPDVEIDDPDMKDLPWNAMSFQVEGQTYTVAYFSHPDNPKGAEMSERLYGRFGEFFPYQLTPEEPLRINYRFWITDGTPTPEDIDLRYNMYLRASADGIQINK